MPKAIVHGFAPRLRHSQLPALAVAVLLSYHGNFWWAIGVLVAGTALAVLGRFSWERETALKQMASEHISNGARSQESDHSHAP